MYCLEQTDAMDGQETIGAIKAAHMMRDKLGILVAKGQALIIQLIDYYQHEVLQQESRDH